MKTGTNTSLPFQLRYVAPYYLGMGITIPFAALVPYGIEPGIWGYTDSPQTCRALINR